MTSFPEGAMKYYHQLARWGMECNKFDVPYLLPHKLVMRGQDVERDCRRQFVLDSCAFMSEFCRDRNPDAGAVQRDWLGVGALRQLVGRLRRRQQRYLSRAVCLGSLLHCGFRLSGSSPRRHFSLLLAAFGSVLFCRQDGGKDLAAKVLLRCLQPSGHGPHQLFCLS
jgi:hypothetical protein